MNELNLKELIELFKTQNTQLFAMWTVLSVVSLGVLGFIYKETSLLTNTRAKGWISFGFAIFAIGSIYAIWQHQKTTYALYEYFKNLINPNTIPDELKAIKEILQSLNACPPWLLVVYHSILDLIVQIVNTPKTAESAKS